MRDLTGGGWAEAKDGREAAAAERAGRAYRLTPRQVTGRLTGLRWAGRARRRRVAAQMRIVARRAKRNHRTGPALAGGGLGGLMPDLSGLRLGDLARLDMAPQLRAALARVSSDPDQVLAGFDSAL
jgi:hypothetical protein